MSGSNRAAAQAVSAGGDRGAEIRRREGIPDKVLRLPGSHKKKLARHLLEKGYSLEDVVVALKVTPRFVEEVAREAGIDLSPKSEEEKLEEEVERVLMEPEATVAQGDDGIRVQLTFPEIRLSKEALLQLFMEAMQYGCFDLNRFISDTVIPLLRAKREIDMIMGTRLSPYGMVRIVTTAIDVLTREGGEVE